MKIALDSGASQGQALDALAKAETEIASVDRP
jgi:hypothetical protein